MFDEQRLGNDGTEASRPCKLDNGDNQMKEKDDDIAHPGMVSKPEKHLMLAQFSNSPWTGGAGAFACPSRVAPTTTRQAKTARWKHHHQDVRCFIPKVLLAIKYSTVAERRFADTASAPSSRQDTSVWPLRPTPPA